MQKIIQKVTLCCQVQCSILLNTVCRTLRMVGFNVMQSSSAKQDRRTGPIQTFMMAKLGMITQYSPGGVISILCQRLSTRLLTFAVSPRASIILQETGQPPIKAGVYALIHSFNAINEKATRKPTNVMIGSYELHLNDSDSTPTLYLLGVHNLVAPTIGICDINSNDAS